MSIHPHIPAAPTLTVKTRRFPRTRRIVLGALFALLGDMVAQAAQMHEVRVECHNSPRSVLIYSCHGLSDCRAFAESYLDDESGQAAAICRPHSFEINVK